MVGPVVIRRVCATGWNRGVRFYVGYPTNPRSIAMHSILIPSLAAALALCSPALAQTATQNAPAGGTGPSSEQGNAAEPGSNSYNLLTIDKLTKDLESAGFTDIRVLADSFVVQAKDKNGNPTVMTLSPSGVFAISEITKNNEKQAKARKSQGPESMQHE